MRVVPFRRAVFVCILALAWVLLGAAERAAAQPSEEQVAAIKSNCRSDYMSYCWSVPRGGPEAAQCLKKNLDKLSPACQQAVKAATATAAAPQPAPEAKPAAPAPKPELAPAAVEEAATPPSALSQPTDSANASEQGSAKATSSSAAAAPPSPKPAPSAAPKTAKAASPVKPSAEQPSETSAATSKEAATATADVPSIAIPQGFIPPRKKLMVFRNCREDLKTYCPDVSYGEGRQLNCLASNLASLTPDCQGALAKLAR